jgi:ABC-type hemin transport system substrate-binding protein
MTIYGLRGVTHGAGRVLTVMSAAGTAAVFGSITVDDDVITHAGSGRLTQYQEKRAGALDRLIQKHDIVVLSKDDWDKKKMELGNAIWR